MEKVESFVHQGLKAFVLPRSWVWEFKRARAIIWLPLDGEPILTDLLIKETGDKILVRVDRLEFFFRTREVRVHDLEGVIIIMEKATRQTFDDKDVEVELVSDDTQQEEQPQTTSEASFSPWELVKGLQIEIGGDSE